MTARPRAEEAGASNEDKKERLSRKLIELLNELRGRDLMTHRRGWSVVVAPARVVAGLVAFVLGVLGIALWSALQEK